MYKTISTRQHTFETYKAPSVKFTGELSKIFPILLQTLHSKTGAVNEADLNQFLRELDKLLETSTRAKQKSILASEFESIFKAYQNFPNMKFSKERRLETKALALAYLYLATRYVSNLKQVIEYESERLPQTLVLHKKGFAAPDSSYTATDKHELVRHKRIKVAPAPAPATASAQVQQKQEQIRQETAQIKLNPVVPARSKESLDFKALEEESETTIVARTPKISWADDDKLVIEHRDVKTQYEAPEQRTKWRK